MKTSSKTLATSVAITILAASPVALAAPPTKEECIEAHGQGQELREHGKVADAKRLFLLCAQQSCPALIQSDCAKFGEELSRSLPSVSFSARDGRGNDLPDTRVTVDGVLVARRLDDGKAYDLDPGRHVVVFAQGGNEKSVVVVLAVGDRGRNISAVLGESAAAAPAATDTKAEPSPRETPSGPVAPLVVAGIGGAALVAGGILGIVGLKKVPDACSRSSHECAAAPGSSTFSDARSAINLANTGLIVGIAGLAVGVTGLVWYLVSPRGAHAPTAATLLPILANPTQPTVFTF